MRACIDSAGGGCFAGEMVVSNANALGAMCASVEARYFVNLSQYPKKSRAFKAGAALVFPSI